MEQKFIKSGYTITNFEDLADIYIINTCTVTNISDKKSRNILRRAKQLNKNSIVVAVGCYAQVAKEKLMEIKEIDLILGNNEKNDIVNYVEKYRNEKIIYLEDVMYQKEFLDFEQTSHIDKTRAVIKIQDGCDRFCSYCIIPYARGRVRSRKVESVVKEVKELANENIKEIVITGIHIASYGKDFNDDINLINLLEELNKINGIERIRLGSLEPMIITEDFLKRLKKLDKICHHFHLSLQSGNNETLKRMNRKYTIEEFENIVKLLRNAYDDVILTTDIIVGFPGETEDEFKKTYQFLENIKFYKMHIFKYSKRDGTKAALMPNQVISSIQEERSKKLIELSNKNQKEYNEEYVNKEVNVLFEEKQDNYIVGHTQNYLMVKVKESNIEEYKNKIINVKIKQIDEEELIALM